MAARRMGLGRPTVLAMSAVIVAGVCAGAVIAGQFGAFGDSEALDEALLSEPMTRVADIPADGGNAARGVFVQTTAELFCYWDAPSATSAMRQGGCNTVDDPLGGRPLAASLAYEGGPAATSVSDARVIGLADPTVSAVRIVMTDGSLRKVALRMAKVGGDDFVAFGYRIRRSDLRKGLGPSAVVALDANGVEIHRQTTGFAE
jgi:hypothetical protein